MGKVWCAHLPLVTMARRDTPKPVTVIYPYYENAQFLQRQLEHWQAMPEDLKRQASLIVVDDGSPTTPAAAVMRDIGWSSVRMFRLDVDVRWNWLAARNIGFHHAAAGWCLVTDMDHMIPEETLRSVIYSEHNERTIYGFRRFDAKAGDVSVEINPHPNSWLMTRGMFWTVGGYDERMSGFYGSDGLWRRRMAKVAPIEILTDILVRYEYQQDSSTTAYKRKQPEDAQLKKLVASLPKGSKPTHLTFPYHEVQLCSALV